MIEQQVARSVSVTAPFPRTYANAAPALGRTVSWIVRYRATLTILTLLAVAALAHGVNMFHLPYYENDEGTYMSQAWAVVHEGQLAPYTYIYDHAPLGWLQLAVWTLLTGGFHTFGMVENSGRVFMLVLQVASTYLVYRIARAVSGSLMVAAVAALLFALSPYAIYYHRRVLLDNVTTFWMLLSIVLLVGARFSLRRVWGSALALGISILSKEVTVFLIPVLAYLTYVRAHRAQRALAVIGWISIVLVAGSTYILLAVLNGELFPYHILVGAGAHSPAGAGLLGELRWRLSLLLGGAHKHVSLIDTLKWQAGRGKDAGIFNPRSRFWSVTAIWLRDDPLLVLGGTACAAISVALLKWQRLIGVLGLATFSLWAFFARGGEVLDFYLVPVLPLLALNIALLFGVALRALPRGIGRRAKRGLICTSAAACIAGLLGGYTAPQLGFAADPLMLWRTPQTDAQQQALAWVEAHIPTRSTVVVDDYMWVDLRDGARRYPYTQWYWKVDKDSAIGEGVFHNNWRNIDYVVATPQLLDNTNKEHLRLVGAALKHSTRIAHFDTAAWKVDVYVVHNGRELRAHHGWSVPGKSHARYWFDVCVSDCGSYGVQ